MFFSTKVLLSKTNGMQEKSFRQNKRQNCGMLRVGIFLLFSITGITGISRGNARDEICAFKCVPSRHAI